MLDAVVYEAIAKECYSQEFVEFAEGYRVSREGVVQSCWRIGRRGGVGEAWRNLKQTSTGKGHKLVSIHYGSRLQRCKGVHTIVCEVFNGPCPEGMQCCHNDGNAANNHVEAPSEPLG